MKHTKDAAFKPPTTTGSVVAEFALAREREWRELPCMAYPKRIREGLNRVNPKAKPEVRVQVGGYSNRIHIDVRLTAAEEKALYKELHKKYGKVDK